MAELLKATHSITTLRVQLDTKGVETLVVVAIDGDQSSTDLVHASPEDFGIPDDLDGVSDVSFRLPGGLVEAIRRSLDERDDPGAPLWIQFAGSVGALTALSWERLLADIAVPILRLPYSVVPPLIGDERMRVAIVASKPAAKTSFSIEDLVTRAIDVAQSTRPGTTIDVFADGASVRSIQARQSTWPEPSLVTVHDPSGIGFNEPSATRTISSPVELTNPWLSWAASVLGSAPVDLVQFVCPGYHCFGQGSLALAQTPARNEDQYLARFVSGTEFQTFLRTTGAWYVHLTDATADVWGIGLRLLADELAQSRAGIVAVDDPRTSDLEEAKAVRRFVLDRTEPPVTSTALYCHPRMLEDTSGLVFDLLAAMQTLTLAGSDAESVVGQHDELAGWVTNTQRFLEEQVGQLLATAQPSLVGDDGMPTWSSSSGYDAPDDYPELPMSSLATSPGDDAAARGVADALKFIADIVGDSSRDLG